MVTLGSDGAIAASSEAMWFQPTSPAANPVDATGCGDAFAAGFLFGWCGARDVRRGLVYGCACGGAAVAQVGGSTPLDAASVNACMRRNEGGLGLGLGLGMCLGLGLRPNPVPKPIPNSIPNPNTPGVGCDLLTYP